MFKPGNFLGATIIGGFIVGFASFFAVAVYLLKQHGDLYSPSSNLYVYLYRFPLSLALLSSLIIILLSINGSVREKIAREFSVGNAINKPTWLFSLIVVVLGSAFVSFGWVAAYLVALLGNGV